VIGSPELNAVKSVASVAWWLSMFAFLQYSHVPAGQLGVPVSTVKAMVVGIYVDCTSVTFAFVCSYAHAGPVAIQAISTIGHTFRITVSPSSYSSPCAADVRASRTAPLYSMPVSGNRVRTHTPEFSSRSNCALSVILSLPSFSPHQTAGVLMLACSIRRANEPSVTARES